ncbi:hypothetical protein N0V90_004004 [Kalmusia sp. IMI 367209]|nr:hypothetical protein N0V90_004004 [Kalmusia sp. IMI 367209]
MDSWKIAKELEERYPTPSLHLNDPIVARFREIPIVKPILAHLVPKVPRNLLNKISADYFYLTREERYKMPLDQLEREKAKEENWEEMKSVAKNIGDLLREKEGPFLLGETLSYADIVFVTYLQFMKRVDESVFQRYLELDPTFPRIYEASKQWLARED